MPEIILNGNDGTPVKINCADGSAVVTVTCPAQAHLAQSEIRILPDVAGGDG